MTRIAALVPMRHESERVPGKNYRDFAGEPLYTRILRTLIGCSSLDEIVIDTDSGLIREGVAERFGDSVRVVERPKYLRDGATPMNAVLMHDLERVDADFYLQTHSTNPLLRSSTIERAIALFLESRPRVDSLFGVTRLQTRLYDAQGQPVNHNPAVLLRTQDLPPLFEENSNLYLFDAATLRETGSRIGRSPLMFEIERAEAWDIDVEIDFEVAEFLYLRREESP